MPPSLYLLLFVYLYTLVFVFFLTFIPLGGHLTWGRAFPLLGFYLPLIILLIRSYPVNTIYSFHSSVHLFMFSFKVYARYVHCHISGQFFPGVKLRIDLTRQIYATHSPKAAKSAVNFSPGVLRWQFTYRVQIYATRSPIEVSPCFGTSYSSGRDFSWHHFALMFAYRYTSIIRRIVAGRFHHNVVAS